MARTVRISVDTGGTFTDICLIERVTAAGTGSMSNFTIGGIHPKTGAYYSYVETYGGGQGAQEGMDGMDGVHVNMTNTRNTPVEVIEHTYPLLVERYSLVEDSGGPGRFRGGMGMAREITLLETGAITSISTERAELSPWGLAGGGAGWRSRCYLKIRRTVESLPGKVTRAVPVSNTMILETAGGGGLGDPLERDPELVRENVLDGLISPQAAAKKYGVIFKPGRDMEIDQESTRLNRTSLR